MRKKARAGSPLGLIRRFLAVVLLLAGAAGLMAERPATPEHVPAMVLTVEGAVGPAMTDYIRRNLDEAATRGAPLVVLKMDTPGGLESSMRDINRAILSSQVPVATWVAPRGARAASAGTYILYASHIAAMAEATHLGAATPVAIGGGGGGDEDRGRSPFPFGSPGGGQDRDAERRAPDAAGEDSAREDREDNGQPTREAVPHQPRSAMEAKAINDAVAYIRGLAELRERNADWAEMAVRAAVSLSATAAAEQNVIDFIAADLEELFALADGRTVKMETGEITLATAGIAHEVIDADWRTTLLGVITNPNVALILMLLGVYGIIFEFLNPGVLVPGTVGAISLILGLYSLALLPLNYAGIGLILLGIGLIIAEAFAPSFGILGIGGTVALVLGAVILVDTDVPGIAISVPLVAGVAVAGVITTFIVAWLARRAFRARVVSGAEDLIGAPGKVTDWSGETGHVWVHGERWAAEGAADLVSNDRVRVTGLQGLVLRVERAG